jgi:hypothetical protein
MVMLGKRRSLGRLALTPNATLSRITTVEAGRQTCRCSQTADGLAWWSSRLFWGIFLR